MGWSRPGVLANLHLVAPIVDSGGLSVTGNIIDAGSLFATAVVAIGDPGGGVAAQTALTNVRGIGLGVQTAMTAPLIAGGGGPATATQITDWLKVYDGINVRWIPVAT